jgi:hypothetical protein
MKAPHREEHEQFLQCIESCSEELWGEEADQIVVGQAMVKSVRSSSTTNELRRRTRVQCLDAFVPVAHNTIPLRVEVAAVTVSLTCTYQPDPVPQ